MCLCKRTPRAGAPVRPVSVRSMLWPAASCRFSLLEFLIVFAVIAAGAICGGQWVATTQASALNHACVGNLGGIGKMVGQYEDAAMFGSIPLAGAHTAYVNNEATLDPFICGWKAGLLTDATAFTCPAGAGPFVFGDQNRAAVAQLARGLQPAERICANDGCAGNYLFTWHYRKVSAPNRVIAADAAAAGFSPNHGDRPGASAPAQAGRAAALFRDGRATLCDQGYTLPGAQARSAPTLRPGENFWDNAFDRTVGADSIGSAIGHYDAPTGTDGP